MVDAIAEFYVLIGNASHNDVLKMLIEAVSDVARLLLLKIRPLKAYELVEQRTEILAALRKRVKTKTTALMAVHMASVHAFVAAHGGAKILRSDLPQKKCQTTAKVS